MGLRESPRFKLEGIGEEDKILLEHLRSEFRRTYNQYLKVIRETGILSKSKLEKKTTVTSRRKNVSYLVKSDIIANTRQCARDKAVECVRLYYELRRKRIKTEFPEFMYETVDPRLNWRDGYRINPDKSVRISVKKGGVVYAQLQGCSEHEGLVEAALNGDYRFCAAELARSGDEYFIELRLEQM